MDATGGTVKLTLIAYSDKDFKKEVKKYSVMINPESIKRQYEVKTDTIQAIGDTGVEGNFQNILPETISFDLVIDGTGALWGVDGDLKYKLKDRDQIVNDEIDEILSVVYRIQKDKFDLHYVRILYGSFSAKCVLNSMNISYTLFHSGGYPLRAKLSLSFISVQNAKVERKKRPPKKTTPVPTPLPSPVQPAGGSKRWECVKWREVEIEKFRSGGGKKLFVH